jgi:hypothetical protein
MSVPEQSPLQPEKTFPVDGVAVKFTDVPMTYCAAHDPGQLIPPRFVETTEPPPREVTVSTAGPGVE